MTTANGTVVPASNGHVEDEVRPLNVAIIGAGIGGLAAAIGLRRQGHNVSLYEQSRFANELGAAIHLAPNANGILRRWGLYAETFGAVPMDRLAEFTPSNEPIKRVELVEPNKMWQHPWQLVHRVRLHEALKKAASGTEGPGTPAKLHTSSKVVSVDAEAGKFTLEDGTEIAADLVIGADGVYSKARSAVVDKELPLFSSGKSAFRFLIPRKDVESDPVTAKLVENKNELIIWYAMDRRVVMYPCNDNETLNFVCIHPDEETTANQEEGWNRKASMEQLLNVYRDFSPELKAMLSKADESTLKIWNLLDMEAPNTWVKGKTMLLGDAAHPFTPHQGQGGGIAMEDAASISVLLPLGTKPDEIPELLKLYEAIRYERAHTIQDFSRQAGKDWVDGKPQIDMMKYTNYNFGHDEWDNSTKRFRKWWQERHPNMYWRSPLAFGPAPGPRQDVWGVPRQALHSTFRTASIKFKTSRTFLENLFPTDAYSFKSPGTVAYASFSCTTLGKMDWLGGGGYNHVGLYIHGVQYKKQDGTVIEGTHMPVLFESLTDPIVTGRDELGMPKIYCAIDIHSRTKGYHMQASWQGVKFLDFNLEGLEALDPSTDAGTIGGENDYGIIVHRYVPAVGRDMKGKADANYPVVVPHAEESAVIPSTVHSLSQAKSASIKFEKRDWEALPTLYYVVDTLADIPIYEIVRAKVVEGTGVPDVSSARRIE